MELNQSSSVAHSCPTLSDCMDCSMPGFPVHHQLPELAQIHVNRISDSIQPTYPLSSPYPSGTGWSKPTFWFSYWNGPPLKCFSSVQLLSCIQLFETPWTAERQASLSIINSKFTQTHVHWVSDAIQPSHPLSSPSVPAFNLSEHQGMFKWVSSLHEVATVLELQLKLQSFQWTLRTDLL